MLSVFVVAMVVLSQVPQGYQLNDTFTDASDAQTDGDLVDSEESCPTWHLWNEKNNKCICQNVKGVVKCNQSAVYLTHGYCMTYDNNTGETHLGKCPYTQFNRYNGSWCKELPRNPNDLTSTMCGQWNRQGYLCSQCKEGYGLSAANYYMKCVECTWTGGVGWLLFFMLQLIPVTVMFVIIIVFRLSVARPPMTGFVLFSQLSLVILYKNAAKFQRPFLSSSASDFFLTLRSIYLPVLSLWNLSFSHVPKLTNFCVYSRILHQQSYLLHFITNVHVIVLIGVAYVLIELHARNYRIIVWLWRPFYKCFVRGSRIWNPRLSTIDTFATFLLLSYTRFIVLSYLIYAFQRVSTLNVPLESKLVLLYNPAVTYFDNNHLPYFILSLVVLFIFVLTPAVILALYQTKPIALCLSCFKLNKLLLLQMFVDIFQGHYKDGTNGTSDLRFAASIFLFLRIALLFLYTLCNYSDFPGCDEVTALVLLVATLTFMVVTLPYKSKTMNKVDIVLLTILVLIVSMLSAVSQSKDTAVNAIVLICILILVAIPQVVFYSFLVYKLSLVLRNLNCSQKILKRCNRKQVGSRDKLTTSQIDSLLLLELSTNRFDSSYRKDSLVSNTGYSYTTESSTKEMLRL